MAPRIYRRGEPDDFPGIADSIEKLCRDPARHCLHSWSGEEPAALVQRWREYEEQGELLFVVAEEAGALVGSVGAEIDEDLGRAWVYGPNVPDDWESIATPCFERLLELLPAAITRLDAYVNEENMRARRWYRELGFEEDGGAIEYTIETSDHLPEVAIEPLPPGAWSADSFESLFETIFPGAYYDARRLLSMHGKSHFVRAISDGSAVIGFLVVEVQEGEPAAEIQFLGVREDRRGEGLGHGLLVASLQWLLDEVGVEKVDLNVRTGNAPARTLYEEVGFRRCHQGVGLRRARD